MDTSVDTSAHTVHPLDPLTSAEIALAAEAVRAMLPPPVEPDPKAELAVVPGPELNPESGPDPVSDNPALAAMLATRAQ